MRITEIEPVSLGRSVFVRVDTDEGISGWGECSPMNGPVVIAHLVHSLRPLCLGADPFDLELLAERVLARTYKIAGQTQAMAFSGIEIGCWDIMGKATGQPVYRLLGGAYRPAVEVYASSMRRDTTPDEEVNKIAAEVERHGFRATKVKIGDRWGADQDASPGRSLALVRAIRKAFGDDFKIMVDANSAYTAARAIEIGRRLEELGVFHFEEPCPYLDLESTAKVAAALDMPIAGGEQDWDRFRFKEMLQRQAVDIIQPDVIKVGGFLAAKKIAALAEVYGAPITQHNTQPTIGTVAMLHFAASTPMCRYPQEVNIESHPLRGLLREPDLTVRDGKITLSDAPGLGLVFDEEKFRALRQPVPER